mmetsp:Transcript_9914/g.14317  ORF Transcript_9914/g.14317 Transcript_9914/m.14317 type:complete len:421 (+) Transcript_9914:32-1294(+)
MQFFIFLVNLLVFMHELHLVSSADVLRRRLKNSAKKQVPKSETKPKVTMSVAPKIIVVPDVATAKVVPDVPTAKVVPDVPTVKVIPDVPRVKVIPDVPTVKVPVSKCPIGRQGELVYKVPSNDKFREISYMAYSNQTQQGNPVVWMGSDGFQNSISVVNLSLGTIINTYKLDVPAEAQADWESLTVGPCDSTGTKSCIYIGNKGNNPANFCTDQNCKFGRELVSIYKLEEPNISKVYDSSPLKVATLVISYAGTNFPTSRADSESLIVDHVGDKAGGKAGDLYFITKFVTRRDLERVGKISVESHQNLSPGSSLTVPVTAVASFLEEHTWTDATMNREGNLIAVRASNNIYFFPRDQSQTVKDALQGTPCPFVSATVMRQNQTQFESVTFLPFPYYAEASECSNEIACDLSITRYKLVFG